MSGWMWIFLIFCVKSQGMVTINILYSLKPSKNTIFGKRGARKGKAGRGKGEEEGMGSLPPRSVQAGRVMPSAAHIYIFINTGLYNETGPCQEKHFVLVHSPDACEREQSGHGTFSGTGSLHTAPMKRSHDQALSHCCAPCTFFFRNVNKCT